MTAVQRIVRLVAMYDVMRRMTPDQIAAGVAEKWGQSSNNAMLTRVLLLVPCVAHICNHAFTNQLPFPWTMGFQVVSVAMSIGCTGQVLVGALERLELLDFTAAASRQADSLMFSTVASLCGVSRPPALDECLVGPAEREAYMLVVSAQLLVGLVLPLYVCYHIECKWKKHFLHGLLNVPNGPEALTKDGPACTYITIVSQGMLVVVLVSGVWLVGGLVTELPTFQIIKI